MSELSKSPLQSIEDVRKAFTKAYRTHEILIQRGASKEDCLLREPLRVSWLVYRARAFDQLVLGNTTQAAQILTELQEHLSTLLSSME